MVSSIRKPKPIITDTYQMAITASCRSDPAGLQIFLPYSFTSGSYRKNAGHCAPFRMDDPFTGCIDSVIISYLILILRVTVFEEAL